MDNLDKHIRLMLALTLCRGLCSFTTCLHLSFILCVYYKIISEWNPNIKPSYGMVVDFNTAKIMETILPEIEIEIFFVILIRRRHGKGEHIKFL